MPCYRPHGAWTPQTPRFHEHENFEGLERIITIRDTSRSYDSYNSHTHLINAQVSVDYISYMSQSFRLFYVSNVLVLNFTFFSARVTEFGGGLCSDRWSGSDRTYIVTTVPPADVTDGPSRERPNTVSG